VIVHRAIRGRLLNRHPHCRGCGFDLDGIDLSEPNRCPECGRAVHTGTKSIRTGTRQRRPLLAVAGCLVLMVGITGVAWPKLSQIPSIRNIDWYGHFPGPLLLRLEAGGDKEALAELHSRLIPGELSDEGLQKLIDRSMAMLDDESVPWDERWGDVLLYAFVQHFMSDEQIHAYAKRSVVLTLKFKDQLGTDRTSLRFVRGLERAERGRGSFGFGSKLAEQGKNPKPYSKIDSGYTLNVKQIRVLCDGETVLKSSGSHTSTGLLDHEGADHWVPYVLRGYRSVAESAMLEAADDGEQIIELRYDFILKDGIGKVFEWVASVEKPIMRTKNPRYADIVTDPEAVRAQLGQIKITDIYLPNDYETIGQSGKGITYRGIFEVYNSTEPQLGFSGEVWFQSGDKRIKFGTTLFSAKRVSGMGSHSVRGYSSRWWMYFIDHREFWDRVEEQGRVDVIVIPVASTLKSHLDVTSRDRVAGVPIIFRDVPVRSYRAISDEPWDRDSIRSQAMSGRNEKVGVVTPELFEQSGDD